MPYGNVYTLQHNAAVSTAITLAQLKAGATCPLELLRAWCSAPAAAASALVAPRILRKSAAATVTTAVVGTHITKNHPGSPDPSASLGTAATGVVASAEGTDGEVFRTDSANIFGGAWEWVR